MIAVQVAKDKIVASVRPLPTETRTLTGAIGYVLAVDVQAAVPLPIFTQSAMDGYAICHLDVSGAHTSLRVKGESKAGYGVEQEIARGEAMRIFTGAPMPKGATTVVMQEYVTVRDGHIILNSISIAAGQHVRYQGQQIQAGEVALSAGTLLTAGALGFLAGFGITHVEVIRKPRVGILLTGDELVDPGQALKPGMIFESNSVMLEGALHKEGIVDIRIDSAEDQPDEVTERLADLIDWADLVLTSGGISVGDYDYVAAAMEHLDVKKIFYKVRQRPGKPLFFGTLSGKLLFALPGNPASSLVCFYEYVLPALRGLYGRSDLFLPSFRLPSLKDYSFSGERDEFLKAFVEEGRVTPLFGQESFALRSFALANALVYLPVSQQEVKKGELVEVHLLP
ncbi:molybdopterin molybdotransferase MoeA [Dyadobacter tibetensis]|uniref:molybdopterin molybdotransferase MoeA n=1 Tax=Dyadobacter tibetensis TaxID=1211851 RepID=UPI0004724E71|nr:gephyrin-like molybdotransferase Glp [Dyadobacter tibetensis]